MVDHNSVQCDCQWSMVSFHYNCINPKSCMFRVRSVRQQCRFWQILEAASKLEESGWQYSMEASFIEVYNETLRDLLAEGRNPRDAGKVLDNNAIKHLPDGMYNEPSLCSCMSTIDDVIIQNLSKIFT